MKGTVDICDLPEKDITMVHEFIEFLRDRMKRKSAQPEEK